MYDKTNWMKKSIYNKCQKEQWTTYIWILAHVDLEFEDEQTHRGDD